jgi:hypothetical protein
MSIIKVTAEDSLVVNKEIQILHYVSHQSVTNKLTFRYQPFHFISLRFGFQFFLFHGARAHCWPGPPHYRSFKITLNHTTLGRTLLDEWSARHRDLYLTTHNNQNRETTMPPSGFQPTIPANERPQTQALDPAATRIGWNFLYTYKLSVLSKYAGHWPYLFFRLDLIYTGPKAQNLDYTPPVKIKIVHWNVHCDSQYSAVTLSS